MYNIKVQRLLRSLDKAYNGEVLPMKEWDTKRIPKTIKGILKKYGLASAVVTAASGVSIALFVHKCYWYVVDVLYGIDEKQFDPKFFTFVGLMAAAFVVSEISLYTKKNA